MCLQVTADVFEPEGILYPACPTASVPPVKQTSRVSRTCLLWALSRQLLYLICGPFWSTSSLASPQCGEIMFSCVGPKPGWRWKWTLFHKCLSTHCLLIIYHWGRYVDNDLFNKQESSCGFMRYTRGEFVKKLKAILASSRSLQTSRGWKAHTRMILI